MVVSYWSLFLTKEINMETMQSSDVHFRLYGGQIEAFFSGAELRRYTIFSSSPPIPRTDIPWKYLVEEREDRKFPLLSNSDSLDNEACTRINKVIIILNTTDDFLVFKISVNLLLKELQGDAYRALYPGEQYAPENLESAILQAVD